MSDTPPAPLPRYTFELTVGPEHIDQLGHVNNIEYVRWVQDAAMQHSLHVGYTWDRYRELGAAFVIRRHELDYLRSACEGDVLEVSTWIESYTRLSATRRTELRNAKGELVLSATTLWVWVTLGAMRPARIPDSVRAVFGGTLTGRA